MMNKDDLQKPPAAMNDDVRKSLEKKLLAKRARLRATEVNPNYADFELEPELSKAFGFPDNTLV